MRALVSLAFLAACTSTSVLRIEPGYQTPDDAAALAPEGGSPWPDAPAYAAAGDSTSVLTAHVDAGAGMVLVDGAVASRQLDGRARLAAGRHVFTVRAAHKRTTMVARTTMTTQTHQVSCGANGQMCTQTTQVPVTAMVPVVTYEPACEERVDMLVVENDEVRLTLDETCALVCMRASGPELIPCPVL